MASTAHQYVATDPDGSTHTRGSNRVYKFAVVADQSTHYGEGVWVGRDENGANLYCKEGWGCWGFSSSERAVAKMASDAHKVFGSVEIVPVVDTKAK